METKVQIQAQLVWGIKRLVSGSWMGVCEPLGISLEAEDEPELRSMIEEAHHTLFLDLMESGELAQFLRDRGWSTKGPIPVGPVDMGVRFDVPFTVVPAPNGSARTAHQ